MLLCSLLWCMFMLCEVVEVYRGLMLCGVMWTAVVVMMVVGKCDEPCRLSCGEGCGVMMMWKGGN